MTRVARRQPEHLLTEEQWRLQVNELLDLYGWDYRYHVGRTKYAPWGWPDIVAIRRRDRRLLIAELKSATGQPTPDQYGVLELLLAICAGGYANAYMRELRYAAAPDGMARLDVELWRPGDTDRVMLVLR